MAWVSRTSRDTNKVGAVELATKNIGPGAYSFSQSNEKARPSPAPFGTSDSRKFGAGSFVTPGPGTYTKPIGQSESFSSANGASTAFRSQTKRGQFNSRDATPGPGSYIHHKDFVPSRDNKKSQPQNEGIRWVRVQTSPSIPAVSQSFGYEEGYNGHLIPQNPRQVGHTGMQGDSVGPGAYDTNSKVCFNKRGVNFAASKSGRSMDVTLKQQAELPGPGQYASFISANQKKQKPTAAFRSTGRTKGKPKSSDAPGPGSYQVPSTIRSSKKPEHLQFFGSTQNRFDEERILIAPGPGQYDLLRESTNGSKQSMRPSKQAPFTSTEKRFESKSSHKIVVDQFYDTPTLASEVEKKLVSRTGVFGSTAKRFQEKPGRDARTPPNVPERQAEEGEEAHSPLKPSPMFASKSTRFQPSEVEGSMPSPGSYDVRQEWGRSYGQGVLRSGTKRFQAAKPIQADTIGPGAYDTCGSFNASYSNNTKRTTLSTEQRFKSFAKAVDTPGPGAYDVNIVTGDMNTPTYNITIAEEMERSCRKP